MFCLFFYNAFTGESLPLIFDIEFIEKIIKISHNLIIMVKRINCFTYVIIIFNQYYDPLILYFLPTLYTYI